MKKISKLKVVLDTNVLLVSLPPRSPYRLIFDKLLDGTYKLYISNEILTEYEEKIAERYDPQTVKELVELLLILPNVYEIIPYFRWKLIVNDAADDKFADAAISANVNYLVTNDKHFNVLKTLDFPKVTICKAEDFKAMLSG
jgi:putative PIN family toxin of toxin-antitoxin system